MEMLDAWTGRTACALQEALRLSNELFAKKLNVSVRTVAAWHQKPELRPKSGIQQVLDATLDKAPAAAGQRQDHRL
jgi:DNA-binding transcriptional regulator YiaG